MAYVKKAQKQFFWLLFEFLKRSTSYHSICEKLDGLGPDRLEAFIGDLRNFKADSIKIPIFAFNNNPPTVKYNIETNLSEQNLIEEFYCYFGDVYSIEFDECWNRNSKLILNHLKFYDQWLEEQDRFKESEATVGFARIEKDDHYGIQILADESNENTTHEIHIDPGESPHRTINFRYLVYVDFSKSITEIKKDFSEFLKRELKSNDSKSLSKINRNRNTQLKEGQNEKYLNEEFRSKHCKSKNLTYPINVTEKTDLEVLERYLRVFDEFQKKNAKSSEIAKIIYPNHAGMKEDVINVLDADLRLANNIIRNLEVGKFPSKASPYKPIKPAIFEN